MSRSTEEHRVRRGVRSLGGGLMRSVKLGLGLTVALALAVAMTASASAASFLSSAKAKLESLNVATQKFVTDQGTIECGADKVIAGESSGTNTTEQVATIQYEGCKAFGFVNVDISPAEFVFLASGEVHIKKLIQILVLGLGCEISVPAQLVNKVDYQTNGKNLLFEPLVTGIKYTAGLGCSPSGSLANGTYKGHSELMIPSGTLSFMATGGTKEPTTLSTTLSGEGKEGGEITINEGSKAKDKATLAGKNAGEATGKVKYNVYSDNKCEHLVTGAGEVNVTAGSVPSSNEV